MLAKSFIILALLFCLLPIFSAGETFELLGVDFPSVRPGTWQVNEAELPYARYPVKLRIHFYLSEKGAIDSIDYFPKSKKKYFDRIEQALNEIKFYPALYKRRPIPFVFPADIEFYSKKGSPKITLYLPYDDYTCIKRKEMLDSALELNGFTIPGLEKFPSYFCYFPDPLLTDNYPYAIFEIELGKSGELIEYNETFSNFEAFSRLIMNAIMYADFRPAGLNGANFQSKFYLIVRFFENLNYPATLWPPEKNNPKAKMPFDYIRMETELYLDSIINPPIPTNAPFGVFRVSKLTQVSDTAYVRLIIDTMGNVKDFEFEDYIAVPLDKIINDVVPKLKFTPARDLDGWKIQFNGRLSLIFDFSKKIRIIADWLPMEAQVEWK